MSSSNNNHNDKAHIWVGSANLGHASPDFASMAAWLPRNGRIHDVDTSRTSSTTNINNKVNHPDSSPTTTTAKMKTKDHWDLIVIGLQESSFVPPNNATIQPDSVSNTNSNAITPRKPKLTHKVSSLTADRNHSSKSQEPRILPDGTKVLHDFIERQLGHHLYHRLVSYQRGEMRMLVYHRRDHHAEPNVPPLEVQVINIQAHATGPGGLANKGGIVATLLVNDTTLMSFTTCHLPAHSGPENYQARLDAMEAILQHTSSSSNSCSQQQSLLDVTLSSHPCFVLGDLNFRTQCTNHAQVLEWIRTKDYQALQEADELQHALRQQKCLAGFTTLPCHFPPTFKVERRGGYHYLSNRIPSYTDRILYKGPAVRPLFYEPVEDFTTSDHKPIRGGFSVPIRSRFTLPRESGRRRFRSSMTTHQEHHLHLFVSELQCDVFQGPQDQRLAPDTSIQVVTNPPELIQSTSCKGWWEQWRNRRPTTLETLPPPPGTCTEIVRDSWNPDWNEEELHCTLSGHDHKGLPLQLGGAQLFVMLIQRHPVGSSDELLGSVALDLESLYRACAPTIRDGTPTSCAQNRQRHQALERLSKQSQDIVVHATAHMDTMVSLDLNNVILLKNGLPTGVLRGSLDAWWIDHDMAHAAKAESISLGLASNDVRISNALARQKKKSKKNRQGWMRGL